MPASSTPRPRPPTATVLRAWTTPTPTFSACAPSNLYGYSKQLFDLHAQRRGVPRTSSGWNNSNVYGPNEYHKGEMRSLVCKAYDQIMERRNWDPPFRSHKPEYRDGEQMRDFVYVKDAVAMTLHLADTKSAGGLYNVGLGVARTWSDLARAIFSALGRQPAIDFIDMPESIPWAIPDSPAPTSGLLHRLRAWKATTLETAIHDDVTAYLQPHAHLGD